MSLVALTTFDNPFDVFDEFSSWLTFDIQKGYNTSGLLARVVHDSFDLPDQARQTIIEAAVDKLILNDHQGILRKVRKEESEE